MAPKTAIVCRTSRLVTPFESISRTNKLIGSKLKQKTRYNICLNEMPINSLERSPSLAVMTNQILRSILEGRLLENCCEETKCAGLVVASDELSPCDTHFEAGGRSSYNDEYFRC